MNNQYEKKSLAERTADDLIEYIVELDLRDGDRIPNEFEIAAQLGVSRSTIREAVKILVTKNILEIRRGAGTFISEKQGVADDPLGLDLIKDKHTLAFDLLQVRLLIEPEIAALSARHATEAQIREMITQCEVVEHEIRNNVDHTASDIRLHQMIAVGSQNIVVDRLIPIINSGIRLFVNITNRQLKEETIETHREIVEAIQKRDAEGAKCAMNLHLIYNRRKILKIIEDC